METTGWFGALAGLLTGLCLGSFAGMASYRWPRQENWHSPSRCPGCGQRIGFSSLIPVISWLRQRGLAACCGVRISPRYAALEGAAGILTALAGWRYGLSPEFFLLAGLTCTLVLLSAIDLETGYIPDGASLTVAALGLGWLLLLPRSFPWWDPLLSVGQSLLVGLALAAGYSKLRGRDMMGWGDVKLMAASALWLPAALIPAYLLLAGVLGILFGIWWRFRNRGEEFPFAPSLAAALILLMGWQGFPS